MRPSAFALALLFAMGCTPKGPQHPPDLEAAYMRIQQHPEDGDGYLALARLYLKRQDYLRARQYLALAERLRARDTEGLFRLGLVAAVRSGQYDNAIFRCRRQLAQKEDPNLRVLLATLLEATGEWNQAESERQLLLAAHPEDIHLLVELARFYQRSLLPNGAKRAADLYRSYLAVAPSGPDASQVRAALRALALSEGQGISERTN